jgi:hypothetical protein
MLAILEIIIILIVVVCIAWVVWTTAREHKQALNERALDNAWREVLDDPHYMERRHLEERKRVVDQARHAAAVR